MLKSKMTSCGSRTKSVADLRARGVVLASSLSGAVTTVRLGCLRSSKEETWSVERPSASPY
jgi:hypothetical protein